MSKPRDAAASTATPTEDDTRAAVDAAEEEEGEAEKPSWKSLGVCDALCDACERLGWKNPTPIQVESIPNALQGRDMIGLAETGSGKTAAFALPMLQALLENPQRLFGLVLAPTRELAFQISEQIEALGAEIGVKCAVVVGGIDIMTQALALTKKPHIIIATPGRMVDHLEHTKGFNLRSLKFLIMDEADRMLSMDFEEELNKILEVIPRERRTYLFSATMTSKVAKLQRASLRNPVKVEVSTKFATPKTLLQQYLFIPAKRKDCYLAYILNEFAGQTTLVFAATCSTSQRLALMLRNLGFNATCLHGQMPQPKRLGALNKFKSGVRNILIATDVASRGLDIPSVDLVLNYDIPAHGKDYIHRVGRTARAGRAGRTISFVTQYDVEVYQRIETMLGVKLSAFPCEEETVLVLLERVSEAQRHAAMEMREEQQSKGKGGRRRSGGGDDEETEHLQGAFKRKRMADMAGVRKNKRGGKR